MKKYKHNKINSTNISRERYLTNIISKESQRINEYEEQYAQIKMNFINKYQGKVNIGLERAIINAKLSPNNESNRIKEYGMFLIGFVATTIIANVISNLLKESFIANIISTVVYIIIIIILVLFLWHEIKSIRKDVYGYNEEILYCYLALEALNDIEKEQN